MDDLKYTFGVIEHVKKFYPLFRDEKKENEIIEKYDGEIQFGKAVDYMIDCQDKDDIRTAEIFIKMQKERDEKMPKSYFDIDKDFNFEEFNL
jgi:hypothetical protein